MSAHITPKSITGMLTTACPAFKEIQLFLMSF